MRDYDRIAGHRSFSALREGQKTSLENKSVPVLVHVPVLVQNTNSKILGTTIRVTPSSAASETERFLDNNAEGMPKKQRSFQCPLERLVGLCELVHLTGGLYRTAEQPRNPMYVVFEQRFGIHFLKVAKH